MEGRHVKLIGIFLMLLFIVFGIGTYIFVGVYFKHTWSLLMIFLFLFLGFFSPATCYGYDTQDPVYLQGNMETSTYLNCRDLGYVACAIFCILAYVIPTVAWAASSGTNPVYIGTACIYVANTNMILAFGCWLKIFIFTRGS